MVSGRCTADTDLCVIGGGPSGLAAAIAARGKGLRVLVIDHGRPPIDKACGEGLMPDSLVALATLGISFDGEETGAFEGIRFLSSRAVAEARFPRGQGRGIRRPLLHAALLRRAEQAGIDFAWSSRVTKLSTDSVHVNGTPVSCRWIAGADGSNSHVRRSFGLDRPWSSRRWALRRHFRVCRPSAFVEIYWGSAGQAYVTPVASTEVCVALISRLRPGSFSAGLSSFPALEARLIGAEPLTPVRGGVTHSRRLRRVTRGNVALIGEASGSVDAITGEGLALGFRQAAALAEALARNDLSHYEMEHGRIMRLPRLMSAAMLLMDRHDRVRSRALAAFDRRPELFAQMLSLHVGECPLAALGQGGMISLGWQVLTA